MQRICFPVALLLLTLGSASPEDKERRTKTQTENVYVDSWDTGEAKSCSSYSGMQTLLVCDDMKFIHLVGDNVAAGMSDDEAYHRAFLTAVTQSKQFSTEFVTSDGSDPEPWPAPHTGRKLTTWKCAKDKAISCSLIGRQN